MSEDEIIVKLACEKIKTNLKRIAEINLQLKELDSKKEGKIDSNNNKKVGDILIGQESINK